MYRLRCLGCGAGYRDDGLRLHCEHEHAPALLRTEYALTRFTPDEGAKGIMRYRHWLPVRSQSSYDVPRSAIFQSATLNAHFRTPNLWLAFNGYWPARGALLPTGTFKDLESAAVLARFPRNRTLVVASAGNTAAALARACSMQQRRAIIVVPESAAAHLERRGPFDACVQIVRAAGTASYDEAIALARQLAGSDEALIFEGGATNVARRDGIATTLFAAVETLGAFPEYFVQAIGSGAGAIAAHEAALRLRGDGRFGARLPKLLLVQNAPSAPVYESWRRRSRALIPYDDDAAARERRITSLWAPVLSAQAPPYSVRGGLYDALCESGGDVVVADNAHAQFGADLFESLEGARLAPASAVALAGLMQALQSGRVARHAAIVLHVTAGGVPIGGAVSAA
ncbi:MAG TPA: cysteate synthase [Candidatus Baltobacteraceae bacterium]|nr:cysteate synthase [Candidatus Baltobacteraceae bacterium]